MEVKAELKKITGDLLEITEQMEKIFNQVKEDKSEKDFITVVKPFVEHVNEVCEKWKELAFAWVADVKPRHFHKPQIEQTAENLTGASVQAFFSTVSNKRFKSQVQSVRFNLESIYRLLNDNGSD